ncbi:MAG: helix-hairpin-helix domain-containing protein [Clostridiales bacterium]|nr:helix-hairpin-helix domain-containing protein [Clostridiales bacterium]
MFELKRNEEKIIIIIIALIIGIALLYRFVIFKSSDVKVVKKEEAVQNNAKPEKEIYIYDYITGEVKKPGLYKLKQGSRISDLVGLAGGFSDNADTGSVNLAEKLKDEEHIKIPSKESGQNNDDQKTSPIKDGKISINTASADELDEFLPGIGKSYAANIVEYRNKNGPFKSIDELSNVRGIGNGKRFESIKDMLAVD